MSNSIERSFKTLLYLANTLNESTNKNQVTEITNRLKAQFYQIVQILSEETTWNTIIFR